jgi:hypothetical protein
MRSVTVAVPTPRAFAQAPVTVNQLPLLAELNDDAVRLRVTAANVATDTTAAGVRPASSADDANAVESAPATKLTKQEESTVSTSDALTAPIVAIDPSKQSGDKDTIVKVAASRVCLTLGPLSANAAVAQMRTWFEQGQASVDVHTDERREVAMHWVYFPPRGTRAVAVTEVERLRKEGVTDVIAVPKGDMANAISLGVFSRIESRDRRLKEMNQRGYQPSVAPRYGAKRATWVDVSAPSGALSDETVRARWPAVEVRRTPCGDEPVAVKQGVIIPIAVGPAASYNAPPSAPHRFHFSGTDTSRSSAATDASQ